MKNLPFCSVVIPALNEERHIKECLESINQQSYLRERFEILLVDNGSNDQTVEIAREYADRVLVKTHANVGAVRNFGAASAKGEILICTDADCVVDSTWLKTGVELIQSNPHYVFGGGLKPRAQSSWVERYWLLNEDGKTVQQKALMGSCIFIRKQDYFSVGGFDESVTSGEDSDLSMRLEERGLTIEMDPKLTVAHLGNPTDVSGFVRRQIWHSENYIKKLKTSIKDKVFLLTLAYSTSIILTLILLFWSEPRTAIIVAVSGQIFPAMLSAKRVKRARFKIRTPKDLTCILLLDNLYLLGRSLGLIKGFVFQYTAVRHPTS